MARFGKATGVERLEVFVDKVYDINLLLNGARINLLPSQEPTLLGHSARYLYEEAMSGKNYGRNIAILSSKSRKNSVAAVSSEEHTSAVHVEDGTNDVIR
jgi:hypothetical protein